MRFASVRAADRRVKSVLCVCLLAGGLWASAAWPAAPSSANSKPAHAGAAAGKATTARASRRVAGHPPAGIPASARQMYALNWGIDQMTTQLTESGQLVRFSYRVTDAAKAVALNEKAASPQLLDEKVHAVLQVPSMEKVGPLRQSTAAETGKAYWMVFSNKGNIVKAGHRVSVVIGKFRVDGLIVE